MSNLICKCYPCDMYECTRFKIATRFQDRFGFALHFPWRVKYLPTQEIYDVDVSIIFKDDFLKALTKGFFPSHNQCFEFILSIDLSSQKSEGYWVVKAMNQSIGPCLNMVTFRYSIKIKFQPSFRWMFQLWLTPSFLRSVH